MKKPLGMTLAALLIILSGQVITYANRKIRSAEEIKAKIAELGAGTKARAKIELRNGQEFVGFISRVGRDDFDFMADGAAKILMWRYEDVSDVNPSRASKGKIALFAAIAGGIVVAGATGKIGHSGPGILPRGF